eukprot:CAMPEP_0183434550 /NCGR_PEP_ID=MMETSP0370-20130417/63676_1 /TAXON_ID=268820 /ORGANISM="Peridinium aciculiferum, Strain PAER-2" /LENGTH=84 /DNA_ID=CAMNT_0025621259 /DNA_START=765 /DNA_END=1017 /DNA_ORIENTATION=-
MSLQESSDAPHIGGHEQAANATIHDDHAARAEDPAFSSSATLCIVGVCGGSDISLILTLRSAHARATRTAMAWSGGRAEILTFE